jgi:glycerol-3-phosphate cytidylyltransferase-like family protein
MAMASNHSVYISMLCMVIYYVSVFHDICVGLNLPLLNPVVNVYCDGVYDMLHLGHMQAFENALKVSKGHRLLVGVIINTHWLIHKQRPVYVLNITHREIHAHVHINTLPPLSLSLLMYPQMQYTRMQYTQMQYECKVISDNVAKDYKRLPIMKESERYATVRACKYVYEVIEDCPLVATKEFIDK